MPRNVVRGRRVGFAKTALAKQFRRVMTPTERILWQALRGNALGGLHFRRQQIVGGFIVDFYCHAAGLVVEVDGGVHEGSRDDDSARDGVLRELGLRVLRISDDAVRRNLPEVLAAIAAAGRAT
jgi:very-short-patch-repair endonuclease